MGGREWGWGEELVELDERGEPGLEMSSNSASVISSGRAFHSGMVLCNL